jgi:hypothetical protein
MAVFNMQNPIKKQETLIALARDEMERGTYANAVPHLVEAVNYNTDRTFYALGMLRDVYLTLDNTRGYLNVLQRKITFADCPVDVYYDLARFHLEQNRLGNALENLRIGVERTNEQSLIDFYEEHRYAFTIGRDVYDDVTTFHNGGIQVNRNDLWGLANSSGRIRIPCEFEQVSTYDTANGGRIIAMQADNRVVALNLDGNPVAIFGFDAIQIGNLSQNIIPIQLAIGKWIIADSNFESSFTEYYDVGTAFNSAIAVKRSDKWGVISLNGETIVPHEYDEIIMDELGRSYAQRSVFAKRDGIVYLYVNGVLQPQTFEDARPFTNDGWAAVKTNGSWGFIDTAGNIRILPGFDDALSFGGHLAAVRQGDYWGYVSLYGRWAIEPSFLETKSFANGVAPVLTERGWQFITLLEKQ